MLTLGIAHPVFDLGEGLFDGVEAGRAGQQEPQPFAAAADRLADRPSLVAGEVVEDVARRYTVNVNQVIT